MSFTSEDFNDLIVSSGIIIADGNSFVTRLGRSWNYYLDWSTALGNTHDLESVANHVMDFCEDNDIRPDCFIAVPEGPTLLGVIMNYLWAKERVATPLGGRGNPVAAFRGNPKTYGSAQDRYFLGRPRGQTVILEDIASTGFSILESLVKLRHLDDVEVKAALVLTNRMELTPIPGKDDAIGFERYAEIFQRATGKSYDSAMSFEQAFSYTGVPLKWMSESPDLLKQMPLAPVTARAIEKEFQEYGVRNISIIES